MDLPLISHPAADREASTYAESQLDEQGNLRLAAHNTVVADRATALFGDDDTNPLPLRVAATLHDFGKATPQFQAHVRPDESYSGPEDETHHARLGALATWFVLSKYDVSDRERLAATLAVARHHQALPDAADYTANTLAESLQGDVLRAQLHAIDDRWPDAATALLEAATNNNDPDVDVSWDAFVEWTASERSSSEIKELCTEQELTGRYTARDKLPPELYDRTLHFWSALTLADKSHAIPISEAELLELDTLDGDAIESYIADLRNTSQISDLESDLNNERERARRQTIRGVHEWLEADSSDIATITLPTGLGKTFTGLSAAFEARDILRDCATHSRPRPIIYALPYTSIIEQTRELFEDPDLWGADPTQSALTVHHYLSETVVHHDERTDVDVSDTDEETAKLLGESWRDGTILTTFVQLFESLTGPSNRQGLKLPALDGALVILDEPQAIPKDWWDAIARLLDVLTDEYRAKVISMTATQPSLLRQMPTTSLLELGQEHDSEDCQVCHSSFGEANEFNPVSRSEYFEQSERVRYSIDDSALSHQLNRPDQYVRYAEAAERIRAKMSSGGSTLAVCNTIDSSIALTDALCDGANITHLGSSIRTHLEDQNVDTIDPTRSPSEIASGVLAEFDVMPPDASQSDWSVPETIQTFALTLNSRYRPFDRRILIHIAELLSTSPIPFVLVSTQAIEAGVDLSFKTVFRDIAPLDSIVQAAGRCNRSYEWGRNGGDVIVWTLAAPDDDTPESDPASPPAHYVYERGSTDAGVRGHLRLISDVLEDLPDQTEVSDAVVSHDAVKEYFEQLSRKSVASTEIRKHIDTAQANWLARASLIGGQETVDVLVAATESDTARLTEIMELFDDGDPRAYDCLDASSHLRVSLPARVIEDAPTLPRIDGRPRTEDGVRVFGYTGQGRLSYDLQDGGLVLTDDNISSRFTTI
jgi:CRISPR-associated endonuclease Cas3-HD